MSFSFKELMDMRKSSNKSTSNNKKKKITTTNNNVKNNKNNQSKESKEKDMMINEDDDTDVVLEVLKGNTTLEKLKKLAYMRNDFMIPKNPYYNNDERNTNCNKKNKKRTIAILLVIVDTLHNEEIWKEWINNTNNNNNESPYQGKLYIHAKYPARISSKWVQDRTLSHSFLPEWNSPEVIRAMLLLMNEALKDDTCERFVFGTESCIPIYNLHETCEILFQNDKSWLNAFHRPKNKFEEMHCFRAVNDQIIPASYVWKCIPGWMMLTRRHAVEINQIPTILSSNNNSSNNYNSSDSDSDVVDVVKAWGQGQWNEDNNNVWAPEEVYFPTMLALLGFLRDVTDNSDQVDRKKVTFMEFKKQGDANPISFPYLGKKLIEKCRENGSVFARKFAKGAVSVDQWRKMIITDNTSGSDNNSTNNKRKSTEEETTKDSNDLPTTTTITTTTITTTTVDGDETVQKKMRSEIH